jgi:hypothetical protein
LSEIVSVPVLRPLGASAGVKVTVTVQDPPAARLEPQLVPLKENASPLTLMLPKVTGTIPVLVMVTVLSTGGSPRKCVKKLIELGDTLPLGIAAVIVAPAEAEIPLPDAATLTL